MTATSPSSAVDLLRFLALSLAVHADAVCCAVDDVEAAIVELSTNDEHLDILENELAGLLDRQRRLHVTRSMIAFSQDERRRGMELRRSVQASTQQYGNKRIQTSRTPSNRSASLMGGTPRRPGERLSVDLFPGEPEQEYGASAVSTRGLSTATSSTAPCAGSEADSVDAQVERLKARIMHLDRYSLRGKLLHLEKQKNAVKEIDLENLVARVVDPFEFPASVRALWCGAASSRSTGSQTSSCAPFTAASHRSARSGDVTLAQHATGKGSVVNHTNIDLLLARACQRLSGRAADALEALASTNVSEASAAAHLLGCMVYAAELDSSGSTDLAAVQELQRMPRDTLSHLYDQCVRNSVCEAKLDGRCFGVRGTVLGAQDFNALPAEWATSQSLSHVPLDEILPPVRHLLSPRFSFADVAELKQLQERRVALQEKLVKLLVEGPEKEAELLQDIAGSPRDRAAAAARLAVAEMTPVSTSVHAWKTMVLARGDER
ncbi:conserved hypothetical protein [Leishmania mexicana MHOM/GT/2001/U1103]|uniref:Uncharacterized protein n=1 Tax=Leishmania mexicana (strain MHOM/GT/2001/U1103) TaxID=929439 RepID=E9B502_LEIMU|nr:conserved hypothetical protein [Leishmania mexicana MHOM/GT/2001/U1103]CBZ30321.1 conserved hypothetical protein [Leishmania mexicana MHOM/GT/2001/U1103]